MRVSRVNLLLILAGVAVVLFSPPPAVGAQGPDGKVPVTAASQEAKQAYLAGFLAGSATAEMLDAGTADSAGLRQALDSLSRSGFRFPFSPTVYGARVDDFYWYENQRPLPIWYTLWEVNNRLRDPSNGRQ